MKQIRIKKWFLQKNDVYAYCSNEKKYLHDEYSWFNVTKETEKAYHISEMHMNIWRGGWVPKSCVLEERNT